MTTLTGRTFDYNVGDFHLRIEFLSEEQLRWTYRQAPGDMTGTTAVEDVTRTDLRPNLILLSWTEDGGTHVIDVFDLDELKLHVTYVGSDGQMGHANPTLTEVS